MTNGDRIRAMDDGQLATELCEVFDGKCEHCPGEKYCREGHTGLIDWLRKEAEE